MNQRNKGTQIGNIVPADSQVNYHFWGWRRLLNPARAVQIDLSGSLISEGEPIEAQEEASPSRLLTNLWSSMGSVEAI